MTYNAIKCLKCGYVVWTEHIHDWRSCNCSGCYIDGGRECLRIGGADFILGSYYPTTRVFMAKNQDTGIITHTEILSKKKREELYNGY